MPTSGSPIRLFAVLAALAGLAVLLLPAAAAPPRDPMSKIDPWVLQRTEDGAQASFLVVLTTQADTSGAAALRSKEAKGRYVFDRLFSTAQSTQGPIREFLDARGVSYRAFWIVNALVVDAGDRALALDLAARTDVDRLSPNPEVRVPLPTEEEARRNEERLQEAIEAVEWGIANTNAPQVWAQGYDGTGMVIGGEDTGYRWTHDALKPKYRGWDGVTANHDYNWHDAIHTGGGSCGANATAPCDDYGHGTHTMGTMVGGDGVAGPNTNDIGMAYGAQWIGCRNMDVGVGTPARYIECHEFMLAPTPVGGGTPDPTKAPHVINNSWGCPPSEGCTDVNILRASIQALTDAGIVYVASAGNAGWSCGTVEDPPAIYDVSFSVAAHSSSNTLADFSSRGPVTVDGSNRRKPDVSAPGVGVRSATYSTNSSYGSMSGTSMAGPHVAGAVALLLDARPLLAGQVQQVIDAFEQSANPNVTNTGGAPNTCGGIPISTIPNNHFGYGRIDVLAAVNSVPLGTATPTVTGTPPTATPTRTHTPTPTSPPGWTCNSAPIFIPDSGAAAPYPSSILVSGLGNQITDVNIAFAGLGHSWPDDVDILLAGPDGQNLIVMSDVGGNSSVSGLNLILDDAAASALPDSGPLVSGTFRPTNMELGDTFPAPAPVPSGATQLATFNGTNPNGTWSLYVVDDAGGDSGSIDNGWCVNIVATSGPTSTPTSTPTHTPSATPTRTPTPTATWPPGVVVRSFVPAVFLNWP